MRYFIPLLTALFVSAASAQSLYSQPGPGPSGNVSGPASSTTNDCVKFADTTGKKIADAGGACGGGSSGLTIDTTTITGGANGRILYDNSGTTGELTVTGSGNVVLSTSPTLVTPTIGAATGTSLSLSGGTVTGVPTPSAGTDAANKTYVDSLLQNFDIKNPANAATTGALTFTPSYSNGSSGVGATLSATLPGVLIIDGYTPALNDSLLIKNQASTLTNGVYTVTTLGTIGINYVLTRRTDFNQTANILYGDSIPVLAGTVNANQQFTMNNQAAITVGTTAITFAQTSGGSQLTQGTGITITGNTVALTSPVVVANGGSNATTVAGARSSFGVDQRSQYGSTTVNLAVTDHYVTACNNNNSGCSTSTWNAAAVWTLPLHSTVNDGDTISISDDLGIVTPTNTLSLAPTTVNAINGSGQIAAGGSFTTASTTITMSQSPPPWLTIGVTIYVYDVTAGAAVGSGTWSGTTFTLGTTSAINSTGAADVLLFSPNTGATSNKFTVNAAFGAASCKLDATTQNWACNGSITNGAAGTLLIGQSNGPPAMTPVSGDVTIAGTGASLVVTVSPGGSGNRIPMTADALTQGFPGVATAISGKYFANSGLHVIGSSTGYTDVASANAGASNFVATIPAATDTFVMLATTQTLTNKTISGASNTLSNIASSSLSAPGAAVGFPGYLAANYYIPLIGGANTSIGAALSTTTTYCISGAILQTVSINKLAASTTTLGTSNIQLAIYNNGTYGRPSTLIAATANIDDTPSPTVLSASITNSQLTPGTYWWCLQANDVTVRMRSFTGTAQPTIPAILGSATAANVFSALTVGGISTTGTTFGTWPTFTSGTTWGDLTNVGSSVVGFQVNTVP